MEYDELLVALARILEQNGKSYFVTGGFAVSVWGRPRATFDIDIVMVINEKDISLIAKALRTLGEAMYVDEDVMSREIRKKGEFNVIHPEVFKTMGKKVRRFAYLRKSNLNNF